MMWLGLSATERLSCTSRLKKRPAAGCWRSGPIWSHRGDGCVTPSRIKHMDYTENARLRQAVVMAVERARLALSLAASADSPVKVIISHLNGEITFSVKLDDA